MIAKPKLIQSAINGLEMEHEEMEALLAQAPESLRVEIQKEMDNINWFHTAVLYWMEHGVWEAIVEHFNTHSRDEREAA